MSDGAGSAEGPRVLVVDDHYILAQALAMVLRQEQMDVKVPMDISDAGVMAAAESFQPDVVLLDLHLGAGRTSLSLIGPLAERGARVLVLTASDQASEMAECLHAGAAAVLPKSEELGASVDAVRRAVAGETVRARYNEELRAAGRSATAERAALLKPFETLTPREAEVLAAVLDGKRADDIAEEQGVSVRTVRSHLEAIRTKLGVRSQLAAVALARQAGWMKNS